MFQEINYAPVQATLQLKKRNIAGPWVQGEIEIADEHLVVTVQKACAHIGLQSPPKQLPLDVQWSPHIQSVQM